jgi:hypothetical protein
MSFGWRSQLAVGAVGEARVSDWLDAQGWLVVDLTTDKDEQRRDVDFLLYRDGKTMTAEVKTDTHKPKNLFLELSVGGKPGYVFKTRAEVLLYAFPERDLLYWLEMPKLLHWVHRHGSTFDLKIVTSRNGTREWQAEGIAVPLAQLVKEGVAIEYAL